MKYKLLFFAVVFICCSFCKAQTTLQIVKGSKTEITYKQGQQISVVNRDGITSTGLIYLVTQDSLYLNNYTTNIALKDIVQILPFFKPNFDSYKPSGLNEWFVGMYMSLMALFSFSYTELKEMWLPNSIDDRNLTKKERRLRRKTFNIGGKYKLVANNE